MLEINLSGKIGSDAVVKEANGKKFLSFSAYHSYKKQDGTYNSTFVNCTYFTDRADVIAPFLKKGKGVFVKGEPSARAYMGKDNTPQGSLDCIVRHVELCGDARNMDGQEATPQQTNAQQASAPVGTPDDLPF